VRKSKEGLKKKRRKNGSVIGRGFGRELGAKKKKKKGDGEKRWVLSRLEVRNSASRKEKAKKVSLDMSKYVLRTPKKRRTSKTTGEKQSRPNSERRPKFLRMGGGEKKAVPRIWSNSRGGGGGGGKDRGGRGDGMVETGHLKSGEETASCGKSGLGEKRRENNVKIYRKKRGGRNFERNKIELCLYGREARAEGEKGKSEKEKIRLGQTSWERKRQGKKILTSNRGS